MKKMLIIGIVGVFLLAGVCQATMVDRGSGMIYDDVADLTWYDCSYEGTWDSAMNWVYGLVVADFDDWRLPVTGDGALEFGCDGSTNWGYNIISSELGFLFYESLGNVGILDTSGGVQVGYGLENVGLFENLMEGRYWFGTEFSSNIVYTFDFESGNQRVGALKDMSFYGLAVRNGDVAPLPSVPEPTTLLLFGFGILGLARVGRRNFVS